MFVQNVRDLHSANECECRDIFTTVRNLGEQVLKIADVRLEAVALSHFDNEEVVMILLRFPMGGVLGEKCLSYLLEIAERVQRQRVKPIRGHTFQTGGKSQTQDEIT